jgi:hypothetical protein
MQKPTHRYLYQLYEQLPDPGNNEVSIEWVNGYINCDPTRQGNYYLSLKSKGVIQSLKDMEGI